MGQALRGLARSPGTEEGLDRRVQRSGGGKCGNEGEDLVRLQLIWEGLRADWGPQRAEEVA